MSRDEMAHLRTGAARRRPAHGQAAVVPQAPESSFWLERTPLPTRRPDRGTPGRSALAPPGTVCPKCDSPLSPSERACPSCGLKRAMFGRFRTHSTDRVPAALEEQWRVLETHWSDPELHERFLAQVSMSGCYAYAASRYRRAARIRQSDAISKLQLERLSRMVHAVMAVSAGRPSVEAGARPYRRVIVLLVALVVLGAAGTMYMFHRRSERAQERIDKVPSSITVRRGRSLGTDGKSGRPFGGLRAASPKDAAPREDGDEGAQEPDTAHPGEPAEGDAVDDEE